MGAGALTARPDRRTCLKTLLSSSAAVSAGWLGSCGDKTARTTLAETELQGLAGGWVGASVQRGHRLRGLRSGSLPPAAVQRRARVLIVGAGVSGLAAARALMRAGIDDVHLFELEDVAGGNARGHVMAGMACPLGAHYLPLPGPQAPEILELLADLGLARLELGRWLFDERHLCHSPQERIFFEGAWHEGLLPPAESGSVTQQQYRRFADLVAQAQREVGFAMPSLRLRWTAKHAALESINFETWLQREGFDDARLRWYLDYCCRDDYGTGLSMVSAWAGLHYFASRHGFHAPGDDAAPREPVLTWPQGNAWLTRRLAAPLADRLHTGRTVLQAREERHQVEVLAWDEATQRLESWRADRLILAVPIFIAARLFENPPAALVQVAAEARYAPWLVANLHIDAPLLQRVGAPASWDNVVYDSPSLGYVDAMHQSLRPDHHATVLSAYWALLQTDRAALLQDDWRPWARRVIEDLLSLHPDLTQKLARIDLMRYGHAMRIPLPGARSSTALQALGRLPGRVQLAHADLAGYSVFEEAYSIGLRAGELSARSA
jgi:predicted NAD/FAD-binding protein